MNIGLIPARYAKALFEYSKKVGEEEAVYQNMKILAKHFIEFPEMDDVLLNPVVSVEDKKKLIIAAAGGDICETFMRFIDLVIQNKREGNLNFIALKFRDTYRESKNIYYAKLTTVEECEPEVIEKLKKYLLDDRKGTIEFDYVIDKSIIGGFIIEYDCNLLDASIEGQIKLISKELLEKNKKRIV